MANELSQTQCLTPGSLQQQLAAFNQPLAFIPVQQHGPAASTHLGSGSSSALMPTSATHRSPYPLLNATSPSSDSLFSVSTSLNSLPSECPAHRSDLDLKMEIPDGELRMFNIILLFVFTDTIAKMSVFE
ncbi:unnamed protein product [Angiostrongylus costaricensis]|uniref:TORC_M domain-containing protein n=1 Tax=Angiostrongylus costaricensis TaxID=334426 RepID=A0A0R3PVM2_ANGCS|nr:unnamed protein product [Angiostrongylus costaricensis]